MITESPWILDRMRRSYQIVILLHSHMHTKSNAYTQTYPFIRIQSCRMNAAAAAATFVLDAKAVSIWVLSAFVYIHITHFIHHNLASFQIFTCMSFAHIITHIHTFAKIISIVFAKRRAEKSHFN